VSGVEEKGRLLRTTPPWASWWRREARDELATPLLNAFFHTDQLGSSESRKDCSTIISQICLAFPDSGNGKSHAVT